MLDRLSIVKAQLTLENYLMFVSIKTEPNEYRQGYFVLDKCWKLGHRNQLDRSKKTGLDWIAAFAIFLYTSSPHPVKKGSTNGVSYI